MTKPGGLTWKNEVRERTGANNVSTVFQLIIQTTARAMEHPDFKYLFTK